MIFYYFQGAIVCDIKIPGLTKRVGGWTVDNWWQDGSTDYDEEYYNGHKYFVGESMSRQTAKRIIDALGGYLVEEFTVPPARQLVAGGPFYVHQFHPINPYFIAEYRKAEDAVARASREVVDLVYESSRIRIYDPEGELVADIGRPPRKVAA